MEIDTHNTSDTASAYFIQASYGRRRRPAVVLVAGCLKENAVSRVKCFVMSVASAQNMSVVFILVSRAIAIQKGSCKFWLFVDPFAAL